MFMKSTENYYFTLHCEDVQLTLQFYHKNSLFVWKFTKISVFFLTWYWKQILQYNNKARLKYTEKVRQYSSALHRFLNTNISYKEPSLKMLHYLCISKAFNFSRLPLSDALFSSVMHLSSILFFYIDHSVYWCAVKAINYTFCTNICIHSKRNLKMIIH